jgi:outer membrane murein-binding lipoprotein Lpp
MATNPTGSVESMAAKAVVSLPTMWRIITVIGSIASTIILSVGLFAINLVRSEWTELRAEVKEMRHRLEEMPDAATLNRLADDVQDLSRRVGRLENQVNNWDE